MKYVIGADVGTQGTKSAIFDQNGGMVSSDFVSTELIYGDGFIEQSPDVLFDSVIATVKNAMEKGKIDKADVVGIAIDGQMSGLMAVDENLMPVMNYDSWLDKRCAPQIEEIASACGEDYVNLTGGQVSFNHGPKMMWLKKERPELYKKTAAFMPLAGYLSCRLCGLSSEQAYYDYTHLHFSGMADNKNMKWSERLYDTLGIDCAKLPRIISPCDIIGGISESYAEAMGLMSGTPVVAGCGDSAASALGAGVTECGIAYDVAGTASILSVSTDIYAPDSKHKTLLYMRSVIPGMWTPLAYIGGGGMCLSWYKHKSGLDYKALDKGAAEAKLGCDGLVFVPHFEGRVCPYDPDMSGMFYGIRWSHTAFDEFRAIMESIAVEYAGYLKILTDSGADKPSYIIGTGGGSQSRVFNKIKADFLGVDYYPLTAGESGTFGSAVCAGVGVGLYDGFGIASNPQKGEKIDFDAAKNRAAAEVIEGYSNFYRKIKNM